MREIWQNAHCGSFVALVVRGARAARKRPKIVCVCCVWRSVVVGTRVVRRLSLCLVCVCCLKCLLNRHLIEYHRSRFHFVVLPEMVCKAPPVEEQIRTQPESHNQWFASLRACCHYFRQPTHERTSGNRLAAKWP